VFNAASILSASSDSNHTLTILIAAWLNLFAGRGIGVMNIMLVSVTERTRRSAYPQGDRRRSRDIIGQFLCER